ncbi:MAG: type pilus assembly protein PilB, partial [Solirubrobacteraceae bacterium]|nr:type pilus assembly protein PilB [Solirubrobacteraceae bacterium]
MGVERLRFERPARMPATMDRDLPPHLRAVPQQATEGALAKEPEDGHPNGLTPPSRRGGSRFLTEVIVELKFAERERVEAAVQAARGGGLTPESMLLDSGAITHDQLSRAVAERYGLDHLDLNAFQVDMAAANLISSSAARRYEALPVAFVSERMLLVAMADPANVVAVDDIAIMTGLEVRPAVASREDIAALIARLNRLDDAVKEAAEEEEGEAEVVDLRESAEDAPVIKLVHSIIGQAVEVGASDIHLEPDGTDLRVRFRIDGVMTASTTIPRRMVRGVIGRVKI